MDEACGDDVRKCGSGGGSARDAGDVIAEWKGDEVIIGAGVCVCLCVRVVAT